VAARRDISKVRLGLLVYTGVTGSGLEWQCRTLPIMHICGACYCKRCIEVHDEVRWLELIDLSLPK
jgi:hypothetical protein